MDNEKVFREYFRKCKADGLLDSTISTAKYTLRHFFDWFGERDIRDISEDDVYNYIEYLETHTISKNGKNKKYKEGTVYREKAVFKKFLGYFKPELGEIIKLKMPKNDKLPEEILTFEEIEKLISICLSNRDRALIATFYESGARKGELLSCQVKHISFDDNGAVLTIPKGKTGSRRIRLVFAASYLRQWLDCHPLQGDREAYIFCSLQAPFNVISITGLKSQMETLAERAGITKKVTPHQFRHSRATHLSERFTEAQMKEYLGWTRDSKMASVYVHLSGRDMDKAVLEMYGIQPADKKKDPASVSRCPRCKELNPETSLYCGKCGLPLNKEFEKQMDNEFQKISAESIDFNDPAIKAQLLKFLTGN